MPQRITNIFTNVTNLLKIVLNLHSANLLSETFKHIPSLITLFKHSVILSTGTVLGKSDIGQLGGEVIIQRIQSVNSILARLTSVETVTEPHSASAKKELGYTF